MPRELKENQRSQVFVLDVDSGDKRLVHESTDRLIEAPNWSVDGQSLVLNADGFLWRLSVDGSSSLEQIDMPGVPEINNDHVLSPDGTTVFVSAQDGHLYAVPIEGGSSVRVSNDHGPDFTYYLHGISPDGATLAYIGLRRNSDGTVTTNVFTIPSSGGADVQVTDDSFPDDGSEFSPDGGWIYFNSERGSTEPGHAQLFRVRADGSGIEQLTFDERVNWFPHVSPDGSRIAYISFPPGTLGHPEDKDVVIRSMPAAGGDFTDLVWFFGGQGSINVPSWDPTGRSIAYVEYPIGA